MSLNAPLNYISETVCFHREEESNITTTNTNLSSPLIRVLTQKGQLSPRDAPILCSQAYSDTFCLGWINDNFVCGGKDPYSKPTLNLDDVSEHIICSANGIDLSVAITGVVLLCQSPVVDWEVSYFMLSRDNRT